MYEVIAPNGHISAPSLSISIHKHIKTRIYIFIYTLVLLSKSIQIVAIFVYGASIDQQ